MASLRKKYQSLVVDKSREPVTTAPTEELAKPPEPVADAPQVPEEVKTESPVEEAAKSAIKLRLEESQRAAEYAQQRVQQQPPQHAEPETPQLDAAAEFERCIADLPERAKGWYRGNPQFLLDPEQAARVNYCHHVAVRETGEAGTNNYFDRM